MKVFLLKSREKCLGFEETRAGVHLKETTGRHNEETFLYSFLVKAI